MQNTLPLELISTLISVVLIGFLFFRLYQYKRKLDVIKELDKLKDENNLTNEDKEFIKTNLKEYENSLVLTEARVKLFYPIFIIIAAVLLLLFPFSEALVHFNIVVVIFIYMHLSRIHLRNFVKFLSDLNSN